MSCEMISLIMLQLYGTTGPRTSESRNRKEVSTPSRASFKLGVSERREYFHNCDFMGEMIGASSGDPRRGSLSSTSNEVIEKLMVPSVHIKRTMHKPIKIP